MPDLKKILVNGQCYEVEVVSQSRDKVLFNLLGRTYEVCYQEKIADTLVKPSQPKVRTTRSAPKNSSGGIPSPIPGVVTDILIKPGDSVEQDAVLIKIEAMKMENNIFAHISGTVAKIFVEKGDEVREGQILVEIHVQNSFT